MTPAARSRLFTAAAAVPCALLLLFCGIGIHEWWLISTEQIAVIPPPTRGMTSVPNVPASSLVPVILGSGVLAAMFAYALVRRSKGVLMSSYLVVALLLAAAFVRRML